MRSTLATIALAMTVASGATGCQTLRPDWTKNWFGGSSKLKESEYAAPVKMAVIWSPGVLNQTGQQSTRGFGGRIYFYDQKNRSVPVEGQLVVYVYNDTNHPETSRPPDRKFAFTPEQFTQHYSPTELGASYSVWIPWDPVGQTQAELTLVPVFTSTGGNLVVGEPSHNLLPGPATQSSPTQYSRSMLPPSPLIRPDPEILQRAPSLIQQTSFQQDGPPQNVASLGVPSLNAPAMNVPPQNNPLDAAQLRDPGMSTLSITMPGSMADRMASAPPQASPVQRLAMQRAALATGGAGAAAFGGPAASPAATASATRQGLLATVQPSFPSQSQPVRYGQPGPPALTGPALPPTAGHLQSPLFPAAQPSAPPSPR